MAQNSPVGSIAVGIQNYVSGGDLSNLPFTNVTSWTPSITINGSATGITYLEQEGFYIQFSNIVFFNFHIGLSSKGASVGDVEIPNLPIETGPNGGLCRIMMEFDTITPPGTYTQMALFPFNNDTRALLTWFGGNNSITSVKNTDITDDSIFYGSGFYFLN